MSGVVPTVPGLLKLLGSFMLKVSMRSLAGEGCESQISKVFSGPALAADFLCGVFSQK